MESYVAQPATSWECGAKRFEEDQRTGVVYLLPTLKPHPGARGGLPPPDHLHPPKTVNLNPLTRFQKLRGLPPAELMGVLQFKAEKALRSIRQDFRVRFIRKVCPNAFTVCYKGLRKEVRFFAL